MECADGASSSEISHLKISNEEDDFMDAEETTNEPIAEANVSASGSQHDETKNKNRNSFDGSFKGETSGIQTDVYQNITIDEAEEVGEFPEDKYINILIIGETGVGKSTFINAFANYLKFENLDEVEKTGPDVLIPCKFTVTDENYEQHVVAIGSSRNEQNELGKSSTQDPLEYRFPISNNEKWIRLIDTPGIGDTRGVDQDTKNCQKIINYIAPFKFLHGILILLKPNSSKLTVMFEFCLKQIFSRLEKSAGNNLQFVFTNTRGTCYRPGETLPCLREVLKNISEKPPFVKIPLSKTNIFCLDNEAFRYLAAIDNGIGFSEEERQYFAQSWKKSTEESWRMILHIAGENGKEPLQPHRIEHTIYINEANQMINQLKQPMTDISDLIQTKLIALKRHTEHLEQISSDVNELRKNLFVPIVDLEETELQYPTTVCTTLRCGKPYMVRGIEKWHYVQRCHEPCYLEGILEKRVGDPKLVYCKAMDDTKTCTKCKCDFSTHMHIYYETKLVDKTIEDGMVKKHIMTNEQVIQEKEKTIREMAQMKNELEDEHKLITKYIAKFAIFLQQNAISPYNDSYRQYTEMLIDRENSKGQDADKEIIAGYIKSQCEYDEAIKVFDEASKLENQGAHFNLKPDDVKKSVEELFRLKHTGQKIEKLYQTQQKAFNAEYMHRNIQPVYAAKSSLNFGIINRCATGIKKVYDYMRGSNESDDDNTSYETGESSNSHSKCKTMEKLVQETTMVLDALSCDKDK